MVNTIEGQVNLDTDTFIINTLQLNLLADLCLSLKQEDPVLRTP